MVVTCVWLVDAGRRDSHARETKLHPEGIGDGVTIFWTDDIHRGIRLIYTETFDGAAVSAKAVARLPISKTIRS